MSDSNIVGYSERFPLDRWVFDMFLKPTATPSTVERFENWHSQLRAAHFPTSSPTEPFPFHKLGKGSRAYRPPTLTATNPAWKGFGQDGLKNSNLLAKLPTQQTAAASSSKPPAVVQQQSKPNTEAEPTANVGPAASKGPTVERGPRFKFKSTWHIPASDPEEPEHEPEHLLKYESVPDTPEFRMVHHQAKRNGEQAALTFLSENDLGRYKELLNEQIKLENNKYLASRGSDEVPAPDTSQG